MKKKGGHTFKQRGKRVDLGFEGSSNEGGAAEEARREDEEVGPEDFGKLFDERDKLLGLVRAIFWGAVVS